MVTASKLGAHASTSDAYGSTHADGNYSASTDAAAYEHYQNDTGYAVNTFTNYMPDDEHSVDGGNMRSDSDEASFYDMPLSYGEKLVLDTYLRGRSRPYDRDRMSTLATPRKRGPDESQQATVSTVASSGKSLAPDEFQDLLYRLTKPKQVRPMAKKNAGEAIVEQHVEESKKKRVGVDLADSTARLSQPRKPHNGKPSSGELEMLRANVRIPGQEWDDLRLSQLSRSTRRGGSCVAWGVRPHEPVAAREHAFVLAGASPRQPSYDSTDPGEFGCWQHGGGTGASETRPNSFQSSRLGTPGTACGTGGPSNSAVPKLPLAMGQLGGDEEALAKSGATPLSYDEQVAMQARSQPRSYDRSRQDILSQPRKKPGGQTPRDTNWRSGVDRRHA